MSAKIKFVLKPFTTESFDATERSWMKRASGEFSFPSEAPQILSWAKAHLDPTVVNDSVAYGIFKEGIDVASAICEVVLTRKSVRSKWMKMMKLRLSPELEKGIFEEDLQTAKDVLDVYAASVYGVLKLKLLHDATILKIYGRSSEQIAFLKALGIELEKRIKHHKISIHDRWLVIENA